jgi:hypothetical protein
LQISLRLAHLFLRGAYACIRAAQLRRKLRHFQHSDGLAFLYVIAYVNIDLPDVSGHFRVYVYILKRFEFPGDGKSGAEVAAIGARDGGRRYVRIGINAMNSGRFGRSTPEPNPDQQAAREQNSAGYNQVFSGHRSNPERCA